MEVDGQADPGQSQPTLPEFGASHSINQTSEKGTKNGIPPKDDVLSKSRLNQYAQKEGIPLPSYYTVNEGFDHAPQFRCSVTIGGTTFTSPHTFPIKKTAENFVAQYALDGISASIKNEDISPILNDNLFCKSMLNEYASKKNMELPKYETSRQKVNQPIFVSSVTFDGKVYPGRVARSKKEAERLGACAVIESILGTDMEGVMSSIIRSKGKLYKPINRGTGVSSAHAANLPIVLANPINSVCSGYRKELVYLPETGISLATVQPKAISHELPYNVVQEKGIPSNVAPFPLSSVIVCQTSRKRKKKNKGKSVEKKPNNEQQAESGPLVPFVAPEPSSQGEAITTVPSMPSTANQEVLPASI